MNRRHLKVVFTESVDPTTALELSNYSCRETDTDTPLEILAATLRDKGEIDLTTSLQSVVSYTLAGASIKDLSGNEMKLQTVRFKGSKALDTHPPRLTEVNPPRGSVSVEPDSVIIVRFSESMDTLSIRRNSGLLPEDSIEVTWGERMTEFRFSLKTLAPGEPYTLYLKGGCSDLDGNRMQEWQFFTYTSDSIMPSGHLTLYLDVPEGETTAIALVNSMLELVRAQVTAEPTVRMKWLAPSDYTALAGADTDGDGRFDLVARRDLRVDDEDVTVRLHLTEELERWKIFDRLEAFFDTQGEAEVFD